MMEPRRLFRRYAVTNPLFVGMVVRQFAATRLPFTSQTDNRRFEGKVTGALGCITWLTMSLLHEAVGDSIKQTGSYTLAMSAAGLLPLLGVAALLAFWGKTEARLHPELPVEEPVAAVHGAPVNEGIITAAPK